MACCPAKESAINPVIKYVLFLFNFIFWLIGFSMVGLGVWAYYEKNKYFHSKIESIYDIMFDLSIVFLVIGCFIFILGFAGCIGALRENTSCLKFYYYSLVVIFLLEISIATAAFIFRTQSKRAIKSVLQRRLITRYEDDDPDAKDFIDYVQENLKCCGVTSDGYKDWNYNRYYNCTEGNKSRVKCSVPHSCCVNQNTISEGIPNLFCGANTLNKPVVEAKKKIYVIGCIDRMVYLVENNLPLFGGLVLGLAVPQLAVITLARVFEDQILEQLSRWGSGSMRE